MSSSKPIRKTPNRTPRRPVRAARSPITSESDREQALRDYKVTIEYKHLKQHAPSGIYVLPSLKSLRSFYGVIFLRRGIYTNAIFKFTIDLPNEYNDANAWPRIAFTSSVYNPHVDSETGQLDVQSAYPEWDPHRHYLVTVLTYLKKIFYMKSYGDDAIANVEARNLSRSNPAEYRKNVERCVRESQRSVYLNEPGCTARFTEENVCHEILRQILKENFKDPATVARGDILDSITVAQTKGAEKVKQQSEAKQNSE